MNCNIYNFFPTLRLPKEWKTIALEAAKMGFTHIYINPISKTGQSGSLYAIDDHFKYSHKVFPGMKENEIDTFLKDFCEYCESVSIIPILDLVPNHVADSSPLIQIHPEWFEYDENGKIKYAYYYDGSNKKCFFGDIVRINHAAAMDETLSYFHGFCAKFLNLGFKGFRVDMAFYLDYDFIKGLISKVRSGYPDTFFLAESIWHVPDHIYRMLRDEGFDCAYNSAFCWDYSDDWFIKEINSVSEIIPTLSIPECHDTDRLINIVNGNPEKFRQRLWMCALMSSAFMMTSGMEFANPHKINVVTTSIYDWFEKDLSFKREIGGLLSLKAEYKPFYKECPSEIIANTHEYILLKKVCEGETVKILINKTESSLTASNLLLKPYELLLITKDGIFSSYPENNNNIIFKFSA